MTSACVTHSKLIESKLFFQVLQSLQCMFMRIFQSSTMHLILYQGNVVGIN